jgi:hypothetical protein
MAVVFPVNILLPEIMSGWIRLNVKKRLNSELTSGSDNFI